MRKTMGWMSLGLAIVSVATAAPARVEPGQQAPVFSLPSSQGKTVSLAEAKGKYVVLEWYNHDCPFVRKQYDSGAMQKLQARATGKGVVWYSINSSAPGKEGYADAAQAEAWRSAEKSNATAVLLDPQGTVGRLYGAKTTPDMVVIDPAGKVVYSGAIDDKPSTDTADIAGAKNYVQIALDEALAGKKVSTPKTKPYGCGVKYP